MDIDTHVLGVLRVWMVQDISIINAWVLAINYCSMKIKNHIRYVQFPYFNIWKNLVAEKGGNQCQTPTLFPPLMVEWLKPTTLWLGQPPISQNIQTMWHWSSIQINLEFNKKNRKKVYFNTRLFNQRHVPATMSARTDHLFNLWDTFTSCIPLT